MHYPVATLVVESVLTAQIVAQRNSKGFLNRCVNKLSIIIISNAKAGDENMPQPSCDSASCVLDLSAEHYPYTSFGMYDNCVCTFDS